MISIITAIYNQLDMNKMFYEHLVRYTDSDFELIIVDNSSDDGSRDYFMGLGQRVKVIANQANYSYPHCQNQGIAASSGDILVFLNNDLLVSPHWDSRMMEVLGKDNRHVVSFGSNDRLFDLKTTKTHSRRYKRVKYPVMALFGQSRFSLNLMRWLTYGSWERFTDKIYRRYGLSTTDGFSGSAIAMNRHALDIIGEWDPTQYGADFDIFFRTCHRSETVGDIRPLAIINGVFIHHYRRLTLYCKYPEFADKDNLSTLEAKWPQEDMGRWVDIMNFKN